FCATAISVSAQATLPDDAMDSCGIAPATLDGWFRDGTASTGGAVIAADGFAFPPVQNTACDFYQWGAQMFLWITSPAATASVTFDTPEFYDVVETAGGTFEFQSNAGSKPNPMLIRTVKAQDIGGTGQAGGGDVLLSEQGSLTYYGIHTNDIYAGYLTGQKAGAFDGLGIAGNFPITQADVQQVEAYMKQTYDNPQAMTMEIKTAWVDAATVDAAQFITLDAVVPRFDRASDTRWPLSGTETMTLALVGVHIVAPVAGHPELVWASFEHVSVAPALEYAYLDASGAVKLQPFDSSGDWTFFPSDAAQPTTSPLVPAVAAMESTTGDIVADTGQTIAPVAVVQENPWGLSPADPANAKANSDLVSLNASLRNILMGALGDKRGNYLQIGGIWTVTGQLPTGGGDGNIRGGNRLANATMESFHQYPDKNNNFQSENCFTCHSVSSGATDGIALSHIFGGLAPLGN
ncbi:hypothetical protein, partial [Puniceibacterium confluentis]